MRRDTSNNLRFTFTREERLSDRKVIEFLYQKNNPDVFWIFSYPFRVGFAFLSPPTALPSVLISIPKRNIKLSVNRNLLKRRTREAYRLSKIHFNGVMPSHIIWLYVEKKIVSYQILKDSLEKALLLSQNRKEKS